MALSVSLAQAAANALATWIGTQITDALVSTHWADASMEFGGTTAKAVTVLWTGDQTVDYVSDDDVIAKSVTSSTRADYTFLRSTLTQPFQIDVWACSDVERDDLVARLRSCLNASEGLTVGRSNADPFRDGVLVALGDGWLGFADFLFDSAQKQDTPDAIQRSEYRSTLRGSAQLVETGTVNKARLRPTLKLQAHNTDTDSAYVETAALSTAGVATFSGG